jgi:hypothetical protein
MRLYVALLAFLVFSSTVVRAELVSDRVIPIWVTLSTTGIILLSIFQKLSFVSIVLILDLTGRITLLQNYYKKLLKQLLSLTINVADPAVYMISGLLPLEAEIHIKVFTMFGNITRAHKTPLNGSWQKDNYISKVSTVTAGSWK